jgi:DNA-binding MarR family transcriptional regulator
MIGVLIKLDPDAAYRELVKGIEKYEGNITHLATGIGVARSTVTRWISDLDQDGYPIRSDLERSRS